VSPLRIFGSAVESLFSQFKHNAGGKLDSCNYVTARCAHLVQQCASGHHSGVGYRLTYLFTRNHMEIHNKLSVIVFLLLSTLYVVNSVVRKLISTVDAKPFLAAKSCFFVEKILEYVHYTIF